MCDFRLAVRRLVGDMMMWLYFAYLSFLFILFLYSDEGLTCVYLLYFFYFQMLVSLEIFYLL